jgi:hypothetical protein
VVLWNRTVRQTQPVAGGFSAFEHVYTVFSSALAYYLPGRNRFFLLADATIANPRSLTFSAYFYFLSRLLP